MTAFEILEAMGQCPQCNAEFPRYFYINSMWGCKTNGGICGECVKCEYTVCIEDGDMPSDYVV